MSRMLGQGGLQRLYSEFACERVIAVQSDDEIRIRKLDTQITGSRGGQLTVKPDGSGTITFFQQSFRADFHQRLR